MKDEKLIVLLFAFRYAVNRLATQALAQIENELNANLENLPDWMLAQMERDLEWNFELMEMHRDKDGKVKFNDDCEFQRPILDAIKAQRAKLSEIAKGTTNGNKFN